MRIRMISLRLYTRASLGIVDSDLRLSHQDKNGRSAVEPVLIHFRVRKQSIQASHDVSFAGRTSTYHIKMCIVNYNRYSCKHTMLTSVDKCPENQQGLPCTEDWRDEGYRLGDCMNCLMAEPDSGHPWSGPGSDYDEHGRLRPSRFATLQGHRWHDRFPTSTKHTKSGGFRR